MKKQVEVKFWKVITKTRRSGYIKGKDVSVIYPVGKVARPKIKGSKLAVFTSLDSAQRWANAGEYSGRKLMIVPCEVENPIETCLVFPVHNWHKPLPKKTIVEFWRTFAKLQEEHGFKTKRQRMRVIRAMEEQYGCATHVNAVVCDAVKCLE